MEIESSLFSPLSVAMVNSHIQNNADCMLHPFRWYPKEGIDEKLAPVRKADMKKVWVTAGKELVPACVIGDSLIDQFEACLKVNS